FSTGGYTLPLEPGTYNIYAFGPGLNGYVCYGGVTMSNLNVKKDFTPAQATNAAPPFALLANGALIVNGTSGNDNISITRNGSTYTVSRSGASAQTPINFDATKVQQIQVDLGDGNDAFSASDNVQGLYVNGGAGDDDISGGGANDTLT